MKTTPSLVCITLFFFILCFTSCATGLKSYERGDYMTACEEAVKKLRGSPNNANAQLALRQAYPLALTNAQREIEAIKVKANPLEYEKIVFLYDRLNKIADSIFHCPAAQAIIPLPTLFTNEKHDAAILYAKAAYTEGVRALGVGTLDSARIALDYFTRINNHLPAYQDVQDKIEQAHYAATIRVIVSRPQLTGKYQHNGNLSYDRLMSDMKSKERTRKYLVRFYTPEEATAENMNNPHRLIVLSFEDLTVGNIRETSDTVSLKKNIPSDTTTATDKSKKTGHDSVTAKYTTHQLEVISKGVLGVKIVDSATGRVLKYKNFEETHSWGTEWATYDGDARALNDNQKTQAKRVRLDPPDQQDLFGHLANQLYANAASFIGSVN